MHLITEHKSLKTLTELQEINKATSHSQKLIKQIQAYLRNIVGSMSKHNVDTVIK
jgi:predicted  nucleic acid-binding Zn-ribbon protein